MELIINGIFRNDYEEKMVELNGNPVKWMMAVIDTPTESLPIVVWGERKVGYVKTAISSKQPVKIVAQLFAKPQTFTNHEGDTVTVPNLQLKLFSFVGIPQAPRSKDPEDNDPTGSFRCFTEEEKKTLMMPSMALPKRLVEKVKPWPTNNGIEQQETWGLPF